MRMSDWHRAGLLGLLAAMVTFGVLMVIGGRLDAAALFVPFVAYLLVRDEIMARSRRRRR
ncbi:MAG: hypothetical protein ACYCSJ_01390 [Acidimicrobiales bacterium]